MKAGQGNKYLQTFPHLRKWINQCICCQSTGYKPNLPENIHPGAGAQYLRKYFTVLDVDEFGRCEQCRQ